MVEDNEDGEEDGEEKTLNSEHDNKVYFMSNSDNKKRLAVEGDNRSGVDYERSLKVAY